MVISVSIIHLRKRSIHNKYDMGVSEHGASTNGCTVDFRASTNLKPPPNTARSKSKFGAGPTISRRHPSKFPIIGGPATRISTRCAPILVKHSLSIVFSCCTSNFCVNLEPWWPVCPSYWVPQGYSRARTALLVRRSRSCHQGMEIHITFNWPNEPI